MLKLEDLREIEAREAQEKLQAEVDVYKEEVKTIMDTDTLKKMEEELMPIMEEHDQYLRKLEYELPKNIQFDGRDYKRSDITRSISYFLNKASVKWEMTLGMHGLTKFWRSADLKVVPYHVYDSTLRTLNTLQYQGMDEWTQILSINEFMSKMHADYTKDTSYTYYLAERHNAILSQMQLISKDPSEEAERQEQESKARKAVKRAE